MATRYVIGCRSPEGNDRYWDTVERKLTDNQGTGFISMLQAQAEMEIHRLNNTIYPYAKVHVWYIAAIEVPT